MNKNIISFFIGLGVLVAACGATYAGVQRLAAPDAPVGGGFTVEGDKYYALPGTGVASQAGETEATTTVLFLRTSDTATSSITGYAGRATNVDLFLGATASTSATSKLQYFVWFSSNKIDWYREDCSSVASTVLVTHGATACVHEWTITGSGVQRKNITIGATQAKYFKIDFGATGANLSLHAFAVPREETPN